MKLRHVTWQSPCDILEKVSEYEAVHPLRHWKDLKHRVGKNRRCFIFTHKAIPRDPIVVLHAALTSEPSSKIQVSCLNTSTTGSFISCVQTLLDRTLLERPEDIDTAVFYSITATQKGVWLWLMYILVTLFHFPSTCCVFTGLSGVELGNYLIRMVAKELLKEFPQQLSNMVTLSPIPGFRKWLDTHLKIHTENGVMQIRFSRNNTGCS